MQRAFAQCTLFFIALKVMAGEPPPQFPRVRGEYRMTQDWRVTLPGDYAKRFEDGQFGPSLVLWKPGITCWTTVYGLKKGDTPAATYEWIKRDAPREAVQTFELRDSKPLRFGCLLHEKPDDAPERWALYTHTIGETGYVLMAVYFDDKEEVETAKKIWFSITETQD